MAFDSPFKLAVLCALFSSTLGITCNVKRAGCQICHANTMRCESWVNDYSLDGYCLDASVDNSKCWAGQDGAAYRGCISAPASNYPNNACQKWTSQYPHKHSRTPSNYPNKGLGDHNYCRNPDGLQHKPWCYTTHPQVRWRTCKVKQCGTCPSGCEKESCMSGNTGTFKATPVENSSTGGFERTVTIVKELAVGDTIEGLDADRQPALCTVEAIGQFGHGVLYGNYTEDHFVLDPASGNVTQHGAVGNRTVEGKYEVMTSCPVGLDEAGTGFTPMDGDFCGKNTTEMGWSDYLLIHASILRIVRATGGYWFSASAYSDFESVVQHGPELCAAMLACAGDGIECDELERISTLFVDNYLADDAREATLKGMPGCGEVGAPGSVSFVVSQGRASSAEHAVLFATGAVAGAAVVALLLMVTVVARSVLRRKQSPPTPAIVELEPGTLKLDPAAPPSKRPSQEGDGAL